MSGMFQPAGARGADAARLDQIEATVRRLVEQLKEINRRLDENDRQYSRMYPETETSA